MSERRRGRRGKGKGRRQGKEFMDAALDAYIRHLALQKWREVTELQETTGLAIDQALRDAGDFSERGAYRDVWRHWWATAARPAGADPNASLFGGIEAAIQGALHEEAASRQHTGDVSIEDTLAYKAFIDHALDRLFEEEAGSLEEL